MVIKLVSAESACLCGAGIAKSAATIRLRSLSFTTAVQPLGDAQCLVVIIRLDKVS